MSKVLIVVDYENEYVTEDSDYFVGDVSLMIDKLNKLISYFRAKKMPVLFVTHVEADSSEEFSEGKRSSIIPSVDFKDSDTLIKKNKISCFYKTNLDSVLEDLGVSEVVVVGMLTNLCVRGLVSDLYDREYGITVITDLCKALSKEAHDFTITDLKKTREEVNFLTFKNFIQNSK